MVNERSRIIDQTYEDDPLPFPAFVTYRDCPTAEQVQKTNRLREADAIFGFYKLKLSAIDQQKIRGYLDCEISADELIQRFSNNG